MDVFKHSWQLWEPLKNHLFLSCFQTSEELGGTMGPLGEPWGILRRPWEVSWGLCGILGKLLGDPWEPLGGPATTL